MPGRKRVSYERGGRLGANKKARVRVHHATVHKRAADCDVPQCESHISNVRARRTVLSMKITCAYLHADFERYDRFCRQQCVQSVCLLCVCSWHPPQP